MKEIVNTGWNIIGETQNENVINHLSDITSRKIVGIYGLRNKVNNKWYVGSSIVNITNRWSRYRRLQCKAQIKLYNALIKYGYENFDKVTLEQCEPNKELLNQKENYWIDFYDSIENGYNIAVAGTAPMFGRKHTKESKNKIGLAGKGKRYNLGRKASKETKQKMRLARVGKKMLLSSVEKTAEYLRGTCWITDGITNKKHEKINAIPIGWNRGMTITYPRDTLGHFIKP